MRCCFAKYDKKLRAARAKKYSVYSQSMSNCFDVVSVAFAVDVF